MCSERRRFDTELQNARCAPVSRRCKTHHPIVSDCLHAHKSAVGGSWVQAVCTLQEAVPLCKQPCALIAELHCALRKHCSADAIRHVLRAVRAQGTRQASDLN